MEIEQLIDQYSDYLYRLTYTYVKDFHVAEEIVQDVFMKFYETEQQYRQEASLKTYLSKIAIHKSYDYLRSWRYRMVVVKEQFTLISPSIEQKVVQDEQEQQLFSHILTLPIKYREVLIFYYYEQLNVTQIAELLKQPVATIKTRLQRARALLKPLIVQGMEEFTDETI